jgi:hypothetical protein
MRAFYRILREFADVCTPFEFQETPSDLKGYDKGRGRNVVGRAADTRAAND